MSDWHFGMDYDMWLYPPVPWWEPDYDYELPEPIEAANIEGTLLVNADDAIEQVRGLQAENAKLREERNHWHVEQVHAYGNWEDTYKRAVELEDENAKLRELVRDMWQFEQMSCNKCVAKNDGYCGIGIDEGCPLEHSIYDRMRELGVEVDEWAITTTDFCPSRACDSTSGSASSTHQSSLETARGT